MNYTETLFWFIGLYEGEGCVCTEKKQPPKLTIAMTDEEPIRRAAEFLGVTYHIQQRLTSGKKFYRVAVRLGAKRRPLVEAMIPHLSKRRADKLRSVYTP